MTNSNTSVSRERHSTVNGTTPSSRDPKTCQGYFFALPKAQISCRGQGVLAWDWQPKP